jgi:polyprenyl-phospho-N-acetylgalactosaminyl synthase
MKILVALPAYNEGPVINDVVSAIRKEGYSDVLVVDDCSTDNTATASDAKVVSHPINRGPGAATGTAIAYALSNNYDKLVLLDSDGQHDPADIKRLLKESNKYDVVIGSRNIRDKKMPLFRRLANRIGSLVTFLFFGLFVRDSQSGFKVLNRKAMESVRITFDGFEFCSEIIGEIKRNKLSYTEVPIKVIYSSHSQSKGQSIANGFRMIARFLFR